jgi:hypothetical protein
MAPNLSCQERYSKRAGVDAADASINRAGIRHIEASTLTESGIACYRRANDKAHQSGEATMEICAP